MSWLVGERVNCTVCRKRKAPIGRRVPLEMSNGMCSRDCPGYDQRPYPGDLWPGETRRDFGYPIECPLCQRKTEDLP